MDAYIYDADIYCEACGEDIRQRIDAAGGKPKHKEFDSSEYPHGPYENGGGESDTPGHCGSGEHCLCATVLDDGRKVGCLLENPLTTDGVRYVAEYMESDPDSNVVKEWVLLYLEELKDAGFDPESWLSNYCNNEI